MSSLSVITAGLLPHSLTRVLLSSRALSAATGEDLSLLNKSCFLQITCSDVPDFDGSVLRPCEDELVAVRESSREDALEEKALNNKTAESTPTEDLNIGTLCCCT